MRSKLGSSLDRCADANEEGTTTMSKQRRQLQLVTTASEIATFRSCRRRWLLYYEEQLSGGSYVRALDVGNAAHDGLATVYREIREQQAEGASTLDVGRCLERAHREAHEAVKRSVEAAVTGGGLFLVSQRARDEMEMELEVASREALSVVSLFVARFAAEDFLRYRVLEVEKEFNVPVRGPMGTTRTQMRLRGKRDLVLEDRATRAIVLGEHKTSAGPALDHDHRVDIDEQIRAYVYALRELYAPRNHGQRVFSDVGHVLFNVVRKKEPSVPHVTKSGLVSVAAIDTTRDVYERALVEQEMLRGKARTPEQVELLESLPQGTDRWVARHEVTLTDRELNEWAAGALADARLMRATREGTLYASRNPSACFQRGCSVRSVCVENTPERRSELGHRPKRNAELDNPGDER